MTAGEGIAAVGGVIAIAASGVVLAPVAVGAGLLGIIGITVIDIISSLN